MCKFILITVPNKKKSIHCLQTIHQALKPLACNSQYWIINFPLQPHYVPLKISWKNLAQYQSILGI